MNGFNQVTLAGNLTRDPELRYTPKGDAVCDVGLAINSSWKDDQGDKHEKCTFVDCTLWRGAAETVAKYLKKGDPLLLTGRLDLQQWDDKQTGEKRSKLKVIATGFTFLPTGRKADGGEQQERPRQSPKAPAERRAAALGPDGEPPAEIKDDDVPF